MSAVDQCSLALRDNLMQPIHMQLSQKLKTFFSFILHFQNLGYILNIFKKRMKLIANLVLRLRATKNMVRYMCKKSHVRFPFHNEYRKRVSTLFKFERQHLRHIYWLTGTQLSCKKSVLVICQRLSLFVNTMTAVDKCSPPNRDNLMEPIHMQLYQKLKTFCSFILHFRNVS